MANNKVVLGSVTIIDISDTTAEAQDVAKDKVFYGADGNRVIGTAEEEPTPTGTISITENGTYDVTNYANAEVNVSGGGMTETLLWSNPNPTSNIATQTVTLNDNPRNYEYIKVEWRVSTGATSYKQIEYLKVSDYLPSSSNPLYLVLAGKRNIYFNNDNTMFISNGQQLNSASVQNQYSIPLNVYGLI